jgi:hypothetical protein
VIRGALLLLVGAALGPQGLALLTANVLALADPAVPVALAAFGILVALEIGTWPWRDRRPLWGGGLQGVFCGAAVGAGTFGLAPLVADVAPVEATALAVMLGVCASASSTLALRGADVPPSRTARIVELDALVPIVAGGLVMAAVRAPAPLQALWLTLQAAGIALVVAAAGWLLLARLASDTEQRVFSIALLLLLGGLADYLSLSALLAGVIAGAFWHLVGGATRESIGWDLARVQQPLLALVLIVAGARAEFSIDVAALAVCYVLLRATAKLAVGFVMARGLAADATRALGARLLAPGVFGVAFALNAARAIGPEAIPVLSVVVLGTIGSQLIAGRHPTGVVE